MRDCGWRRATTRAEYSIDLKKWLPPALWAAAAVQEDTPLKKHRLVLFSVSDSKDAPF